MAKKRVKKLHIWKKIPEIPCANVYYYFKEYIGTILKNKTGRIQ